MDFYIIGAVFIVCGIAVKALAARYRWIGVPRSRRTIGDVVIIATGATVYLFSLVIFLMLIGLAEVVGLNHNSSVGMAWFSTAFLVFVFGTWLGWKMGPDPVQRARMPDRFAENSDNPFGAPDLPADRIDLTTQDSESH